jgi:protein TonB
MLRFDHPRRVNFVPRPTRIKLHLTPGDGRWHAMPYGAPELKAVARDYLAIAVLLASALWFCSFYSALLATRLWPREVVERSIVIVPYRELSAPPPLTQSQAPPPVAFAAAITNPTVGIAVPVPDAEAPPEQTIASQSEIAALTPAAALPVANDVIVVAPPSEDELPKYGEYVFVEELPEAVTRVQPVYPDVARDANVDGTVLVQALVGKDGRVKDTRVVRSVPMLDAAAVTAVGQWVFKPALSNNRPVAVWVAVPVRFTLQNQ